MVVRSSLMIVELLPPHGRIPDKNAKPNNVSTARSMTMPTSTPLLSDVSTIV
jgi:hypothetical protein